MGSPTFAYRVLTLSTVKKAAVLALRSVMFAFGLIGEKFAFAAARPLGAVFWLFARATREATLRSIEIAFPGLSKAETERMARAAFVHQVKNFIELMRYPCLDAAAVRRRVRLEGAENLRLALARGKGVILLVPHLGNWEILGATLGLTGHNVYSFFLDARIDSIGELLNSLRESKGIKLIPRAELKKSVRALADNAVLGVIADQDGGENGVYTEFFGRTVSAPKGPAALARRTGATILPIYTVRDRDDGYTMVMMRPIVLEKSRDKEADIEAYTVMFLRIYERIISSFPDQWLWMYDRWKERRHVTAYLRGREAGTGAAER